MGLSGMWEIKGKDVVPGGEWNVKRRVKGELESNSQASRGEATEEDTQKAQEWRLVRELSLCAERSLSGVHRRSHSLFHCAQEALTTWDWLLP
jgi:hypothetical protein